MKLVFSTTISVAAAIKHLYTLPEAAKHKERLEPYQRRAQGVLDFRDNVDMMQMRDDMILVRNGDSTYNVLGNELEDQIKGSVIHENELFGELLEDEELMSREPFIRECLRTMKNNMERELSDDPQALNYRGDPALTLPFFFLEEMDHIPTMAEFESLGHGEMGKKLADHMKAVNDYYEYTWKVRNAMDDPEKDFSQEEYEAKTEELLDNIRKSAETLKDYSVEDYGGLLKYTMDKPEEYNPMRVKDAITEKKKNSFYYISDFTEKQKNLIHNHILPDEQALLNEFAETVDRIVSDYRGGGTKIEHLADPGKSMMQKINQLKDQCFEHLKNGFKDNEEKHAFFLSLDKGIKEFKGPAEELKKQPLLTEGTDPALLKARNMVLETEQAFASPISVDKRISALSAGYRSIKLAADPDMRKKLYDYCDMLTDTKSGYLFHTNSDKYTKIVDTARKIMELSSKENLTDLEFRKLSEQYTKLADSCDAYLNQNKKLRKQHSDTGDDRFDASLGILNLLDPERAEKVVAAANAKRSKKVNLSSIMEKSERKTVKRANKNGERTYSAPALEGIKK